MEKLVYAFYVGVGWIIAFSIALFAALFVALLLLLVHFWRRRRTDHEKKRE